VVAFSPDDGYPIIETSDGRRLTITPAAWAVHDEGKIVAEITQVPLRLAWAITIHKSQGMSLDAAEIDLRNAFTYGQGYVALSRVRSLAGMKVLGLNGHALLVDPRVVNRDGTFRAESEDAEAAIAALEPSEVTALQQTFVRARGGTWTDDSTPRPATPATVRRRQGSSEQETLDLLRTGKSAAAIAAARGLSLSTIWGHLETLASRDELTPKDVATLTAQTENWDVIYPELAAAFLSHGTDRLKPVYDALAERYDYDLIRLGRLTFTQTPS
jgi:hypothetical protein